MNDSDCDSFSQFVAQLAMGKSSHLFTSHEIESFVISKIQKIGNFILPDRKRVIIKSITY